jgi:hypothetical protein
MSKESLAIYLRDHLAGAAAAIAILEALRDERAGEALGQFAEGLLTVSEGRLCQSAGGSGARRTDRSRPRRGVTRRES